MWPFGPAEDDDDGDFPKRPVLMLPGICASILHLRKVDDPSSERRVWVTLAWADYNFQQIVGCVDAETGKA